ncbi:MAG: hypothetical protein ACRYGK_11325 [Janthinobacterium lividum]
MKRTAEEPFSSRKRFASSAAHPAACHPGTAEIGSGNPPATRSGATAHTPAAQRQPRCHVREPIQAPGLPVTTFEMIPGELLPEIIKSLDKPALCDFSEMSRKCWEASSDFRQYASFEAGLNNWARATLTCFRDSELLNVLLGRWDDFKNLLCGATISGAAWAKQAYSPRLALHRHLGKQLAALTWNQLTIIRARRLGAPDRLLEQQMEAICTAAFDAVQRHDAFDSATIFHQWMMLAVLFKRHDMPAWSQLQTAFGRLSPAVQAKVLARMAWELGDLPLLANERKLLDFKKFSICMARDHLTQVQSWATAAAPDGQQALQWARQQRQAMSMLVMAYGQSRLNGLPADTTYLKRFFALGIDDPDSSRLDTQFIRQYLGHLNVKESNQITRFDLHVAASQSISNALMCRTMICRCTGLRPTTM